jgi:hypothetical protein
MQAYKTIAHRHLLVPVLVPIHTFCDTQHLKIIISSADKQHSEDINLPQHVSVLSKIAHFSGNGNDYDYPEAHMKA